MAPIPEAPNNAQKTVGAETIALYARNAGFPADQIVTAVAVALGESGGKLAATNRNSNGTTDYGLWQINSVHKDLPGWNAWYEGAANAHMAKRVYDSQGWRGWTVYKTGAYRLHIAEAESGAKAQGGELPETDPEQDNSTREAQWFIELKDVIYQVGNAIAGIAQAVWKTMVWVSNPHNWVRAALVAVGGALVVGALVVVAKPQTSVIQAVQAAPHAVTNTARKVAA